MKRLILLWLLITVLCMPVFSQNENTRIPSNLPPEIRAMIEKQMKEAAKHQDDADSQDGSEAQSGAGKPLIQMTSFEEPAYTPAPSSRTTNYPYLSGRSAAARTAALIALEHELEKMPFVLPKFESTPSKEYMLQMASDRNKAARQKFSPVDLADYSRIVVWVPSFEGKSSDAAKADAYSLTIALATINLNRPYLVLALSSAVFALDPRNPVSANNFAAAIRAAGDELKGSPFSKLYKNDIAVCYSDAEAAYLYAIYVSMKKDEWSDDSLSPVLNLGNLCMDLGKLEEARSLFQVARRIKPESWDAAVGLASYFTAIKQPLKAQTILEDDNLDRPVELKIAIKSSTSLRKSDPFVDIPADSPEQVYEEGIKIMDSEPIMTSADFVTQLDQSERNKMRYFIEHLPVVGSFSAPSISKLTQYSSLRAISGPQGVSALEDFQEMLQMYGTSSYAEMAKQQLERLSRMGLKVKLGVDLDDVARHPEKYADKDIDSSVTVSGQEEFMANIQKLQKQAEIAQRDLSVHRISSTVDAIVQTDPSFAILQMDANEYADPMNVLIQKHNFLVCIRKTNLYMGKIHSLNKKMAQDVKDDIDKTRKRDKEIAQREEEALERYKQEEEQARSQGGDTESAEWKLKLHAIHTQFFNEFNANAEVGFGSASNTASSTYVNKIKKEVEKYYYDVIRHIGLISDPEVRDRKEAELRKNIETQLNWALNTVLVAFGSFSYQDDWDCDCDLESLLKQRDEEQHQRDAEEEARIARNKAAKQQFDSREIPESSQLWKKLDSYVDNYNFILVKVRASCARTVLTANSDFIPNNLPVSFFYKSTESEFTGAVQREAELMGRVGGDIGAAKVAANAHVKFSSTTDGDGAVKDFVVTSGAEGEVKVGHFKASAGVDVDSPIGPNGVGSYSIKGNAAASVEYGNTEIQGGAKVVIGPEGIRDSDYSVGITQSLKNEVGGTAKVELKASTKEGCEASAGITQQLDPAFQSIVKDPVDNSLVGSGLSPDTRFGKKTLWSGKFEYKKKE